MLIFALKDWVPDPPPKDGNDETALDVDSTEVVRKLTEDDFDPLDYMNRLKAVKEQGGLRDQLEESINKVFESLYNLLKHDTEGGHFQEEEKTREIMSMSV